MPSNKEKKIHLILKQARRPVCMALVLAIVFIYGQIASADTGNTFIDLGTYYDIVDSGSTTFFWPTMKQSYINEGNDLSKLTYVELPNNETTYAYMRLGTYNKLFPEQVQQNAVTGYENNLTTVNLVNTFTRDSVPYDFTNAYTLIFAESYTWSFPSVIMRCKGSGSFAVVDGYLISDQNFAYITYYAGDYNNSSAITPGTCSVASADGFYKVFLQDFYNAYGVVSFTDLDIYFSSTDGSSGFSEGSFDFASRSTYYNFNFLKTGGFIVSPADPSPVVIPEEQQNAHHYLDFNCQAFYSGSDSRYVYLNLNMSWNENMIKHPEFYTIHVMPYVKLKLDSESVGEMYSYNGPVTIPYDYEEISLLELRNTVGYIPSVLTKKYDLKRFISGQRNAYDVYGLGVQQWGGLFAWQEVEGDSGIDITKDGLLGSLAKLLAGSSTPTTYVKVKNDLSNYFDYYEIWARVWITSDEESYSSGVNESHYDFLSGKSYTDSTDNNINNYPPDSDLPSSVISNSGQLANGSSGSVNNGFSGVFNVVSNMNANIEYLYNLDTSDFNNIAGNTTSALQGAINFITSNDQNTGFGAILTRSYGLIPDDIKGWIKATVAALLGGAILGWVYNGVRIKRG